MGAVARILTGTLDHLIDKVWVNREPKVYTDETCLIVSFGDGVRREYKRDAWTGSAGLPDAARKVLLDVISEKYPDRRGRGEPLVAFNDHPSTSRSDVLDVVLEAKRRVDSQ